MPADDIYLAHITAYDTVAAAVKTLRYATRGFATAVGDTPPDTYYDERIVQPAVMRRDLAGPQRTRGRSTVGYGDLVLANDDGGLDGLLGYAFDGRPITILRGRPGQSPSAYKTFLVATMAGADVSGSSVTIKLRDRQQELDKPLQGTLYAGDNALPAGLEGVEDLKGKPKPLSYGVVRSIAPPCVNTSKLIYQVHDGAVASLDAVYDRGVALHPTLLNAQAVSGHGFDTGGSVVSAYGAGVFVGGGLKATTLVGRLASSTDGGATWTERDTSIFGSATEEPRHAVFDNGLYMVIGGAVDGNGRCATSANGTSWTNRNAAFSAVFSAGVNSHFEFAPCLAFSPALGDWWAGALNGKAGYSSDGGATWTNASYPGSQIVSVAVGAGVIVMHGGTTIYTLPVTDATRSVWTLRTAPFTTMSRMIYAAGLFVLVGTGGQLATSINGIDWTMRATGTTDALTSINSVPGVGFIVTHGANNKVLRSLDGVVWFDYPHPSGGSQRILTAAYDPTTPGTMLATGQSALILRPANIGTYASTAELQDDGLAPAPGAVKVYLAGGYFRLGATPAGQITADVTQGAAAANRTAGQVFGAVLTKAGKVAGTDYSTADLTALDTATASAVIGHYSGLDVVTVADVLDRIAGSVGAWWGVDRLGVYRIKQFTAPASPAVLELTGDDLIEPLRRVTAWDPNVDLPVQQFILRYRPYWHQLQATDLAGAVSPAQAADLEKAWREVKSALLSPQPNTKWLLAPTLTEETLLDVAADAQTEADRRGVLYGAQRDRFEAVVELDWYTQAAADYGTMMADLGDVARLSHSRFGLAAGRYTRIIAIEPDARRNRVTFSLWG